MSIVQTFGLLILAVALGLYAARDLAPTFWAAMTSRLRRPSGVRGLPPTATNVSARVAGHDGAPRIAGTDQPNAPVISAPSEETRGAWVPALRAPVERAFGARRAAVLWEARGCWGGLLAFGLAALGQNALTVNGDTAAAGWYYLIAIIVVIAALYYPSSVRAVGRIPSSLFAARAGIPVKGGAASLSRVPLVPARLTITRPPASLMMLWVGWKDRRARLGKSGTIAGLALTGGIAGAATVVLQRNTADPLGGWLWAAAVATLILTFVGAPLPLRDTGMLAWPEDDVFARGRPRVPVRLEAALVAAMLGLALALRLINLENMPGIFGDEGERGMAAVAINQGNAAPLFGFGWYGVPNLYFYCLAPILRLFGDNMVGDRMLSVLSGVVTVVLVYRIGRLLWGPRAGLIAGTLMSVSPLALQFSRQAGESTPTGALWAGGFLLLCRALRAGGPRDWVLTGIVWGFSLYFYAAGKLIIAVIPVVGLYCLLHWRRSSSKDHARGFVLLVLAFVLTCLPIALVSMHDYWQTFTGRAQETSIFSPQNQALTFGIDGVRYDPAQAGLPVIQNLMSHPWPWAQAIFAQMRITTEVFNRTGDPTSFYKIQEHRGSMLPPLWAMLTFLGLAYAGWRFWDARFGLISLWFWVGLLAPALTINTPSTQRLILSWPAIMLFPAVLLDHVSASAWPLGLAVARRWATVPLAALLVFFGIGSYHEYFVHYASLCPYCDPTTQARYAQALDQTYKAYQLGVGDGDVFFSYGATRFVAQGVQGDDLAVPADFFPITDNNGKGAAFIVYDTNKDYLPLIRLFYPGGREEPIKSADGVTHFVSYKVTAAQMAGYQTLHATYTEPRGRVILRDEPNLGTLRASDAPGGAWAPPAGLVYPERVTWWGGLVAPTFGHYTLSIGGTGDRTLQVDGQIVMDARASTASALPARNHVELMLARGVHEVRLTGALAAANSRLDLRWALPSAAPSPVRSGLLFHGPTGGLSGDVWPYTAGTPLAAWSPPPGASPITRRNDPFFGFREATSTFGQSPYVVRWRGILHASIAGAYDFETTSNGPSVAIIDGHPVVGNLAAGAPGTVRGAVYLSQGQHRVEIRYAWQTGPGRLEWYWTPPGGARGLVPPTALSPHTRSWLRGAMPD